MAVTALLFPEDSAEATAISTAFLFSLPGQFCRAGAGEKGREVGCGEGNGGLQTADGCVSFSLHLREPRDFVKKFDLPLV